MKIPERLTPVYAYRNLKHGRSTKPLYSILYKGKVIARRHQVLLSNATFVVRKAGREKVLKTGHKNVHAFVRGTLTGERGCMGIDASGKDFGVKVSYNPYVSDEFRTPFGSALAGAGAVLLNERGITACYTYCK